MARPKKNTNPQALADKMRKAVLQAAIEGKLTEQNPSEDGYARDLLADIESEKQRLVKAGEIKREKSPTLITEEEKPFDIPDNWEWVRLGSIGYAQTGSTPPTTKKEYFGSDISFIKPADISNSNLILGNFGLSKSGIEKSRLIKEQSILMVCIGGSIGKAYFNTVDVCCNQQINAITPILSSVHFMLYVLQSEFFQNALSLASTGTATPIVNKENWRGISIPLPPLDEQQRIVAKLQEVMPKLDELSADENALYALQTTFPRQMQASLLQAAIEGKLTQQDATKDGYASDLLAEIEIEKQRLFEAGEIKRQKSLAPVTDEEKPFDIPDNWEWARLGSISNYGQSKKVNPNDIPSKSLVIEMEDIEKETFHLLVKNYDRTPRSSKSIFKQGDVLYGKLRPYLKKIIVTDDDGYCSTEIIPFNGFGKVDSNYLKICMSSPAIDNYVNSLTHGMDMPRLGTDKAINLLIPIPPLAEQQRIVDLLERALPEIQTLKDI